jgi:hypothetical protein
LEPRFALLAGQFRLQSCQLVFGPVHGLGQRPEMLEDELLLAEKGPDVAEVVERLLDIRADLAGVGVAELVPLFTELLGLCGLDLGDGTDGVGEDGEDALLGRLTPHAELRVVLPLPLAQLGHRLSDVLRVPLARLYRVGLLGQHLRGGKVGQDNGALLHEMVQHLGERRAGAAQTACGQLVDLLERFGEARSPRDALVRRLVPIDGQDDVLDQQAVGLAVLAFGRRGEGPRLVVLVEVVALDHDGGLGGRARVMDGWSAVANKAPHGVVADERLQLDQLLRPQDRAGSWRGTHAWTTRERASAVRASRGTHRLGNRSELPDRRLSRHDTQSSRGSPHLAGQGRDDGRHRSGRGRPRRRPDPMPVRHSPPSTRATPNRLRSTSGQSEHSSPVMVELDRGEDGAGGHPACRPDGGMLWGLPAKALGGSDPGQPEDSLRGAGATVAPSVTPPHRFRQSPERSGRVRRTSMQQVAGRGRGLVGWARGEVVPRDRAGRGGAARAGHERARVAGGRRGEPRRA